MPGLFVLPGLGVERVRVMVRDMVGGRCWLEGWLESGMVGDAGYDW